MNIDLEKRVLLVDDTKFELEVIKKQLGGEFNIVTAVGAEEALRVIDSKGPFAVVCSDMSMPGVSGLEFLNKVKEISPESVRLMLTGNSDQDVAVKVVNENNIFRFLCKPCSTADLKKAFSDAISQYSLVVAEKELLQNTLKGSIKVLMDILSNFDPESFNHAARWKDPVEHLCGDFNIANSWEVELAAMLYNIGFTALPTSLAAKYRAGLELNAEELSVVESLPRLSKNILKNIPRLINVSEIVYYQNKNFDGTGFPHNSAHGEDIPWGARLIKIFKDLEERESCGQSREAAISEMLKSPAHYDQTIFAKLIEYFENKGEVCGVLNKLFSRPEELREGQKILTDIITLDGVVLVAAGTALTHDSLKIIKNHHQLFGIQQPILIDQEENCIL
ncbi:MAG: response regulator [Proteobacteria bacterium]|nr:response regulator [Pseudomonadota bacterium]